MADHRGAGDDVLDFVRKVATFNDTHDEGWVPEELVKEARSILEK